MKDNFSIESDKYAAYRPVYPEALFGFLRRVTSCFEKAWDCGTGNGQIAGTLAHLFNEVYATDISQSQIDNAIKLPNIFYSVQPAEKTNFKSNFFDLVIVGQAVHWFDFGQFYSEVKRTAKQDALLVIVGYGRPTVSTEVDKVIDHLYYNIIGNYWDKERKYVDEGYLTIPFPFEELVAPAFKNTYSWTLKHLIGYLDTWSAARHYQQKNNANPVELIYDELVQRWGPAERVVEFPVLVRIGKIH